MTAPQLEGAALFRAAARILGLEPSHYTKWELVPAMLEWLRGRGRVTIDDHYDGGTWARLRGNGRDESALHSDLPTALARLVVRVAEIEGGKP